MCCFIMALEVGRQYCSSDTTQQLSQATAAAATSAAQQALFIKNDKNKDVIILYHQPHTG